MISSPVTLGYALEALCALAHAEDPRKCRDIAHERDIPLKYLVAVMSQLRTHQLVFSRRGARGGYWLAKKPESISAADVARAVADRDCSSLPDAQSSADPEDDARSPALRAVEDTVLVALDGLSLGDILRADERGLQIPAAAEKNRRELLP